MNLPIEISDIETGEMPQLPIVFGSENLEALYKQVEEEVKAEVPDVETDEGRKRIKSLAAKISSSKTAIDKPIREHLRALKAIPKVLEQNARESIARFDALRDKTLAPLNEAQAEQDAILAKLNEIPSRCLAADATSSIAGDDLAYAESVDLESFWPELRKKAKTAKETAVDVAKNALDRIRAAEAQAAEIERLRVEAAKREQEERDRKIREEAEAKARAEAEAKARQEREDIERRAVEAKQREEAQRMAAEQAKRDAELAEQRRIEQEERSRQAAIEAEEKAKSDAAAAAERAAQAERERIEAEQAEAKRLADARAADKEHRITINRAALVDLIAQAGLDEDQAKAVVTAIAKGQVRNVKIFY
jgi:hypothetical protein